MKKLSLLLACFLVFALASCSKEEKTEASTEQMSVKTDAPTLEPTDAPSADAPTLEQTDAPSADVPTLEPTDTPSESTPTEAPSESAPTDEPSADAPTLEPTDEPSADAPTLEPTDTPSESTPSDEPSADAPTLEPTDRPSESTPADEPSADAPTLEPTDAPSADAPTLEPTDRPSESTPADEPSADAPTLEPTDTPSESVPTEAFALIFTLTETKDSYCVTGYTGSALDVVIPESYEGLPVTAIGEEAFVGASMQTLSLPATVSVIGEYAFKDCRSLKSVSLPADIVSIGAGAFQRCNALDAVCYAGSSDAWKKVTLGIRNTTLTGATFTYLDQPSIHDEPEEVLDKIYTIIEPKSMTLSNGDLFNYRMYVPETYDASKAYPVLILLHGAGERGDDNTLQMKNMVATLFADEDSPIQDAIFLCPQCPTDNQWVDTPWADGNYSTDEVAESNEIQGVLEMLASVRENYNVDADRIYVMGISMGGFGTWDIITRHPELFAAAIPICGGGDPSKAASIAHIPIRTFHGDADKVVPVDGTRAMVEALQAVGGNVTYEELPGYGHNVWDYTAEKEGLMDWLFSQTKGATDIEENIDDLLNK